MNQFKLSSGKLSSDEERMKLREAKHNAMLKRNREKYHKTKGLTAAQRMMGETR